MTGPTTRTTSALIPTLRCADAPAAIDWLCRAFGFAGRYDPWVSCMRQSRLAAGCAIALLTVAPSTGQAQTLPADVVEAVDREVRDALAAEQAVFDAKDCTKALEFFTDRSPLFVVSGRTMPNRNVLRMACTGMVANRAQSPRTLKEHVINVLSPEVAYSVTYYDLTLAAGGTTAQVVTKIWVKQHGAWRIAHLHESVRATPPAP